MQDKNLKNEFVLATILILFASLSRLIPFLPNFQPIMGIAVFSAIIFSKNRYLAFGVPLVSMLLSDLLLSLFSVKLLGYYAGFYDTIIFTYLGFALITLSSSFFIKNTKISSILLGSASGAVIFFIITNFGSWLYGLDINNLPYSKDLKGFLYCYTSALPFFKNTLISSILFTFALFGAYQLSKNLLIEKRIIIK